MKRLLFLILLITSLYSIDFKSVKFEDFVRFVSHISQKNIVISDGVQKDFHVFLPELKSLDSRNSIQLLRNICSINDLTLKYKNSVYLISKKRPQFYKSEPRVIKFKYLSFSDLNQTILSAYPNIHFSVLRHRILFNSDFKTYQTIRKNIELLDSSYLQKKLNLLIFSTSNKKLYDLGPDILAQYSHSDIYIKLISSTVNFSSYIPSPMKFISFINALKHNGVTEILSNPNIYIVDGKKALLQDTITIPYKVNTTTTQDAQQITQESIDYRDIGLKLEITDVVLSDNHAEFDLLLEYQTVLDKTLTPTTTNKLLRTHITLHEGEYILLGGINSTESFKDHFNIPIVENIPILGNLTKHEYTNVQDKTFSIVLSID